MAAFSVSASAKALVLGGGALKGAFQAGAVVALFESGFQPDVLYGISVGSLNAAFLTHDANRQMAETGRIDWPLAGRNLIELWIRNITGPQDVGLLRPRFSLGWNTLMSRFDGLLDNSPLHNILRKAIDPDVLRQGPVQLKVGAVDIISGDMVYADAQNPDFMDYLFASGAIPLLMPAVQIGGDHRRAFLDGGLREVAPIREAIDDGLTDIACIVCHARQLVNQKFNYRNVLNLLDRVKDITVNQLVNNDIVWAERFADRIRHTGRPMHLSIVRPPEPFDLDLMKFTSEDISALIVRGYQAATDQLAPPAPAVVVNELPEPN
jgi:NTE family protein